MKSPALIVLAALMAGCASAPDRRPPASDVEFPAAWGTTNSNGALNDEAWWESFGPPELAALVDEALAGNRELSAAAARLEAATANARIAGADLYPTLSAGFDASRSQRNFIGFPIPGSSSSVLTTRSTSYGLNLATSWELDLWGRIRAGKSAALAEIEAVDADLRALRHSIAAQTVKTWLELVATEQQLQLARATVDSLKQSVTQIERRYRNGLVDSLDLRLARTDLESGRASVSRHAADRERVIRRLEVLVGRYPSGELRGNDTFPPLPASVPAGLPSELLSRRPDLVAAERRLAVRSAQVRAARAALFPRISLTASGGTSTEELNDLFDSDFSVWTLAGNLTQPLFQGGRLVAGIDLSTAREREAVAGYGRAVLTAFSEVETALAIERDLAEQEAHLNAAAAEAEASLEQATARYGSGLANVLTVLTAQRNRLNADGALISIRQQRRVNRVDLHLALGGGFDSPSAPVSDSTRDDLQANR